MERRMHLSLFVERKHKNFLRRRNNSIKSLLVNSKINSIFCKCVFDEKEDEVKEKNFGNYSITSMQIACIFN